MIVDHTTTSVAGAITRTQNLAAVGVIYQHAPVFMAPLNALESTGVMLFSGDKKRYDQLSPQLMPMTGKLVYLGEDAGRGAALKLAGNLMLMAITTGLADAAAFLKAVDVPRSALENLFEHFNPGASVQPRTKRMLSGEYENPSWELRMARKDARLILSAGVGAAHEPPLQPPLQWCRTTQPSWIAGLKKVAGEHDWTVIGKDAIAAQGGDVVASPSCPRRRASRYCRNEWIPASAGMTRGIIPSPRSAIGSDSEFTNIQCAKRMNSSLRLRPEAI